MIPAIIHEPRELATLLDLNAPPDQVTEFDPVLWLRDTNNIALRLDSDLAMFEHVRPGVYGGHIWFASKGADALETARIMLEAMFERFGATSILGEIPVWRRDVAWFMRKLGFRKVCEAEREKGNVYCVRLTKRSFITPTPQHTDPC